MVHNFNPSWRAADGFRFKRVSCTRIHIIIYRRWPYYNNVYRMMRFLISIVQDKHHLMFYCVSIIVSRYYYYLSGSEERHIIFCLQITIRYNNNIVLSYYFCRIRAHNHVILLCNVRNVIYSFNRWRQYNNIKYNHTGYVCFVV